MSEDQKRDPEGPRLQEDMTAPVETEVEALAQLDHVFVPAEQAEKALATLKALQAAAQRRRE